MGERIAENDMVIIRPLAEKFAAIAVLPVHRQKMQMWRKLNSLQKVKPMVCIYQIPWHEFGIEKELVSTNALARQIEYGLRLTLYMWENVPTDAAFENKWYVPLAVKDTGFGLDAVGETAVSESEGSIASRHFEPQIKTEKDIEKIKFPQVQLDESTTEQNLQATRSIFADIIPVEIKGASGFWFAPWDQLITWWGVQEALLDLAMRPEMVKAAMDRLVNAWLHRLDQYEKLNLLALNNGSDLTGSGGFGFSDELPKKDYDASKISPCNLWGCAAAQIFSEVSPQMHREFALEYELRWLRRFGLNYYGCCEPLHKKISILREIQNLRKISISPWSNLESAVEQIGRDFVLSYKPNPAIFAEDKWDLAKAESDLRRALKIAQGAVVEVVMKDISTVRGEPRRLEEWARMAMRVCEEFS